MRKRWIIAPEPVDVDGYAQRWGVPRLVAQLLLNRGINDSAQVSAYLSPQLKDLIPPCDLPGCREAAVRVAKAIRDRRRIVLYGDYDVDGVTGVAILWHILQLSGAAVRYYIPHRLEEGYGLNLSALRQLVRDGAELIISIDCGVTAAEIVDQIGDSVELIVTDHHTPGTRLPDCLLVHPVAQGPSSNPELCGAGVAFKLAWAIAQELSGGERVNPVYRELLSELVPLAALGTIADVVSLAGENRIIARHGLKGLVNSRLAGIRALIEAAGLSGSRIDAYDVGFKLAPRLNAAGRMGHAQQTVELLTTASASRAREIALYLNDHNQSRQAVERQVLKSAEAMIAKDHLASDARRAIVLASSEWHAGVVGIVAARIVDRFYRPAILVALDQNEGQGSGRSIHHFDLAGALAKCADFLVSFGGHRMAAGLKIAPARLGDFTEAFLHQANNQLTGDDLVPKLRLDGVASLDWLTLPTVEAILGLGPFGQGNPRPRFASGWLELASEPRCVGSNANHLQASFMENGSMIRGIGFGCGEWLEDLKHYRRCRVAFEPIINEFNGRRTVEMNILDFQFPGEGESSPSNSR